MWAGLSRGAGKSRPRWEPGIPDNSTTGTYEDARRVLNDLAAVGIDYDDVMQTLEDHGVTAFDASWDQMAAPLREALIR